MNRQSAKDKQGNKVVVGDTIFIPGWPEMVKVQSITQEGRNLWFHTDTPLRGHGKHIPTSVCVKVVPFTVDDERRA
jgi:hypothetical protein